MSDPTHQFPRTDGSFDPWVISAGQLVQAWLASEPHPEVPLPRRPRSTAQWLAWLDAEGFIEEASDPYGYVLPDFWV